MDPLIYWRRFNVINDFWYNCLEAICILIGAFGFILNIFVIHFLLRSKNAAKATSNRCLLINLALSDILKLVSSIPLKLLSTIYKHWIFGDFGCQLYGFIGGFAGFLSTSTLAIMAIERYFMIKNPLNDFKNKTKSIITIIFASWLYSLFWASVQFFSERGFVLEGMLTSCSFDYLSDDMKSRFIIMSILLGGFIIPLILLVVFYSLVIKTLKAKVKSFSRILNGEESVSSTTSPLITTSRTNRRNALIIPAVLLSISNDVRRRSRAVFHALMVQMDLNNLKIMKMLLRREFKVTKAVVIFIAIFFLSWMPYIIIVIMAQFGTNIENYITPLTVSLPCLFAKSSTILNPLIYTLINSECKCYIKRLFGIKSRT